MDSFRKFIAKASSFVELKKGAGSDEEIRGFLSDLQNNGIELTDNSKYYGYLLVDSMKALYANISSGNFFNLIEFNLKFVEQQKGIWDHVEWLNLLSDIQEKGIELNDDTKDNLGLVLDATRMLYVEKAKYQDLIELAGIFVEQHKGTWGHAEWLNLLSDIQKKGIELNENTKKYLGLVLEHMKAFFSTSTASGDSNNSMLDIAKNTAKFMIEKRFIWGAPEWLEFLSKIQGKGVKITTEEAKNSLGNILDSAKKLMGP